jgi:hypothetical protein
MLISAFLVCTRMSGVVKENEAISLIRDMADADSSNWYTSGLANIVECPKKTYLADQRSFCNVLNFKEQAKLFRLLDSEVITECTKVG